MTLDDPDFPSLVAVIVAVPSATPLTSPVVDTVAMLLLLEPHVTTRSVTTVPFASLTTAVSCVVDPLLTLVGEGVTVTVPTGTAVTTTEVEPLLLSLVAVIVAVPGDTAVMRPADDTVAIVLLLELHVTTRFVTVVPFASFTVIVGVDV